MLVQPGSKKCAISGVYGDRVKVLIQAPPVDGKANKALCSYLSRCLGIKKTQVQIEKGFKNRRKDLILYQISQAAIEGLIWK